MGVTSYERRPPASVYQQVSRQHQIDLEESAAIAVDRATTKGGQGVKSTIRAVGLGNLANAVGTMSSLRKGRTRGSNAWGAIFAKGGEDSLASQSLGLYATGGTIRPKQGEYLWFQTKALKRRIGTPSLRSTPARYAAAGSPLGPLIFRRKSAAVAELFVKGVVISPKNGRARRPGVRSKVPTTISVLFIGIRQTTRLKRLDLQQIVTLYGGLVPAYILDEMVKRARSRG